jgi:hypothetical protein
VHGDRHQPHRRARLLQFYIGKDNTDPALPFSGRVDDFRIYRGRALSDAEVRVMATKPR